MTGSGVFFGPNLSIMDHCFPNKMPDPIASSNATSRSLLADARGQQPAAWVRLVSLYAPLVAAWCRRFQVREQDIGDLLQDVFAAVAGNLKGFRKEQPGDTFRGWLATITRNKVRDYHRRAAATPTAAGGTEAGRRFAQVVDPEALEAVGGGDEAAENAVLQQALAVIRGEFQEKTWQAFWSVVAHGRSASEVAAELGMQPGAVRVAKSRVLMRLRRELGDL
jgi:RNA polymerase sigma-70 factor (ECF subfamily)